MSKRKISENKLKSVARTAIRFAPVIAVLAAGLAAAAPAQADRAFSLRFSATEAGSIGGIANSNMSCSTASGDFGASTCVDARNAAVTDSVDSSTNWRNNNAHTMTYVDVDGVASTFNSSSANQSLPAGSTILYAALYWGGHYAGATSPANQNIRDQVKFRVPGATGYQTVTASTVDDGVGGNAGRYQAFANVTSLVQTLPNSGNGTYTVADIQSAVGSDRYSGWSLIVSYKNPSETVKNMTIYDGLVSISGTTTADIPISGFLTPPAGPVNAEVGFVAWEGDLALIGDRAQLNGQFLSDAQHPSNNFFNSRISQNGVLFTDRNPSYPNSLGMDALRTPAPAGSVTNSQTSATVRVRSDGDFYLPGVITFQVEVYSPKVDQLKSVVDDNGGVVEQGDTLTYKISGKNNGLDGTANFVLRDPIPPNTTYVPGSINVVKNTNASTGVRTDAFADDIAEFDSPNNRIIARLGEGSNASTGGNVKPGNEYEVTFKVKVNGPSPNPVANDTVLTNTATASFLSQTTSSPLNTASTVDATVKTPDLTINKSHSGNFRQGQTGAQYSLAVTNQGPAGTNGQVSVTDNLPTGLTATAISGTGWNCVLASLTCTRSDVLAANASYPPITMTVNVANNAPASVINSGTVSGGGDPTPSTANDPTTILSTNLVIDKSHTGDFRQGQTGATYTLAVTNSGPDPTTGTVTVTDALPAGLTATAISGTGWNCVLATLTCTRSDVLAANASYPPITMTVNVANNAPASVINGGTVSGGGDPTPSTDNDPTTIKSINLVIAKSHTGNFRQSQTGAQYTIAVTNSGPDPTQGQVSVTDTLPTGLTATAISGTGWNCTLATLTCTRSDVLAANASYPNITMTVNVANDAPASVVNSGTVTGGGDPTPSTANDPTTILSTNLVIDKSHSGNFTQGQTGAHVHTLGHQQRPRRLDRPRDRDGLAAGRSDRHRNRRHRLELHPCHADLHPKRRTGRQRQLPEHHPDRQRREQRTGQRCQLRNRYRRRRPNAFDRCRSDRHRYRCESGHQQVPQRQLPPGPDRRPVHDRGDQQRTERHNRTGLGHRCASHRADRNCDQRHRLELHPRHTHLHP